MTTHGGKRNRSGPAKDPLSARSEREGIVLTALPNEGYTGGAPDFPLPDPTDREIAIWESLWTLPQAAAWSLEKWRWLQIGNLARLQAKSESAEAPVAIYTVIRQLNADHGITSAGLIENGWAIAQPDINKAPTKSNAAPSSESKGRPERRMRAV